MRPSQHVRVTGAMNDLSVLEDFPTGSEQGVFSNSVAEVEFLIKGMTKYM
jgi:hypothetical protein